MPPEKLLERIEAATDPREGAALLGVAPMPKMTVSAALEEYWPLIRDKTLMKSPDQMRRLKNPVNKAIRNFISQCGDKPIDEVTRDDMLDFREWWMERLVSERLTPNSGNKDLGHLSKVLKTVNNLKRLGLDLGPILSELTFKEGEKRTRPPFSTEWIKAKILAHDALSGMNKEARCLLLGMVNTGYRPSEGTTLNASTIHLSGDVPYIEVKTDGREVKSPNAKRIIPLLGVSLEAFRECPNGFPRYFDKPGVSATVNNFFNANGLRETPEHSLYSLRHSFEDRMLAANIDERVRRDLMGHNLCGEEGKALLIDGYGYSKDADGYVSSNGISKMFRKSARAPWEVEGGEITFEECPDPKSPSQVFWIMRKREY